jgi:hypothetical protein
MRDGYVIAEAIGRNLRKIEGASGARALSPNRNEASKKRPIPSLKNIGCWPQAIDKAMERSEERE